MQTTGWCTVAVSWKRRPSRSNFKPAWQNAAWRCIPPKPRSSIARMVSAKGGTRTSRLTSSGTNSAREWSEVLGTMNCSAASPPAVSPSALKAMRSTVRDLNIRQLTQRSLDDIARKLNPLLRGWIGYYGRYNRAALEAMLRHVNLTLVGWVMRKFKRFQARKVQAARFLEKLVRTRANLFEHWRIGMIGAFA